MSKSSADVSRPREYGKVADVHSTNVSSVTTPARKGNVGTAVVYRCTETEINVIKQSSRNFPAVLNLNLALRAKYHKIPKGYIFAANYSRDTVALVDKNWKKICAK